MSALLWNFVLALTWTAITGDLSVFNFLLGFGIGVLILFATRRAIGTPQYPAKIRGVVELGLFFVWEVVLSSLRVARDVVRPTIRLRPAVIAVPLDAHTDAEITLLASLITLTPGSTAIDFSPDKSVMYVHAMNLDQGSVEAEAHRLKTSFERRLLEVMR